MDEDRFYEAVADGVERAMWRMITNATQMPCEDFYDTIKEAAEKALIAASAKAGAYFDQNGTPARHVVFFIEAWGRWVGAMDYSEMFKRSTANGGYIGAITGFFTY
jgi:hypothetical protein